ncbi:MAG: type IV pilin [Methanomicrobiales archaeon]|nr:type IV pilin [Methanomicrobiales archaeon]
MGRHRGEEGVSEVVATILLIGVTVLLVAIVAAIFFSGPQPGEIPHASIVAKNESGKFALAHEGGDPLRVGEYRIYVDTGNGLVDETANFTWLGGDIWQVGGSIRYTGTWTSSERVVVTVISGGVETILTEVRLGGGRVFDPDPMEPEVPEKPVEPDEFIDFVINESVFVYGTTLSIGQGTGQGSATVIGPGATVVITGGLKAKDIGGGGAGIAVSNIYIDGDVNISSGSAGLGSADEPGAIYINGNLTLLGGSRHIYGKVYVNGDFDLGGVIIHNKTYVNGDVTLRRDTISFLGDAHIYCTGNVNLLSGVDSSTLDHCTDQTPFPGFTMLDLQVPPTKPDSWYMERDYVSSGDLTSNRKIFADSYTSSGSANNVIIIASDGDISITGGGNKVTGVFFAPRGRVTFSGDSLEGVVIARDGLYVTGGGTKVTFKNIEEYITNPEDYPF